VDIYSLEHIDIPTSLVLAIMATLGYVFGTLAHRRRANTPEVMLRLRKDLSRAQLVVNELGKVICTVNSSTAKHYARLKKFQNRVAKLGTQQGDVVWHELCREVEGLLDPTLQLVGEIANAQERIRYQSNYLMTFSEMRTDSLTGLGNRRAMDHMLSTQIDILKHYDTPFSLAIIDIDHFKELNDQDGHQHGDQMLRDLAELLLATLRTIDIVTRYGGDELVVVMPHTHLAGAGMLCERLRGVVEGQMPFTVSVGVASATGADTPESLFKRADAALYRAKSSGRNRMCCDQDETVEPVLQEQVV
jgi:diguanylate cyclase (GGDEF)-like protein